MRPSAAELAGPRRATRPLQPLWRLASLLALALTAACEAPEPPALTIAPSELLARIEGGTAPLVLDVRTPGEYAAGHIPGAFNIPHDELASRIDEVLAFGALGARTGATYAVLGHFVVYCRTGRRTRLALPVLEKAGYDHLIYLEGQWQGWVAAGMPVETETPAAFFDDFGGGAIDTTRWQVVRRNWGGQVKGEISYNGGVLPENVQVRDGQCVLTARGDHYEGTVRGINGNGTRRPDGRRTGAALRTVQAFASGSYEARLKVAPELGVCSAIWTCRYDELPPGAPGYRALPGREGAPSVVNHEIDIEFPGRPGPAIEDISFGRALMVTWTGLQPDERTVHYAELAAPQNDGAFHTYRFDWHTGGRGRERRVDFYVDGELVHTSRTTVPTRAGHFWIGAWFPRDWAGVPDFDTAEMVVDWVRILPFAEAGDED